MTLSLHPFRDDAPEALRLANALKVQLALIDVHRFPDGEITPRVSATRPTAIVYRSLHAPNGKLIELLLSADALRRNGATRLVLIAPYLPYMRQDAVFRQGEPISQRVIAQLLGAAFDRIITVDPHLHRTPSLAELFPTCKTTRLFGADALISHLRASPLPVNTLVVGPDVESGPLVRRIAEKLGFEHATLTKQRQGDARVEISMPDMPPTEGRPVLVVDDICSTGGTLCAAVSRLKALHAGPITVFVTHLLGGAPVVGQLRQAGAASVISTDACAGATGIVHLAGLLAGALEGSETLTADQA